MPSRTATFEKLTYIELDIVGKKFNAHLNGLQDSNDVEDIEMVVTKVPVRFSHYKHQGAIPVIVVNVDGEKSFTAHVVDNFLHIGGEPPKVVEDEELDEEGEDGAPVVSDGWIDEKENSEVVPPTDADEEEENRHWGEGFDEKEEKEV